MISSGSLTKDELDEIYGEGALQFQSSDKLMTLVISQSRPLDLIELEQLLQSVGWSQRPTGKVRRALANSLLKVGLWKHESGFSRLIGFARCTGDGVLEATVWDVAILPVYQGLGFGKKLMTYVNRSLQEMGIKNVIYFVYICYDNVILKII